MMSPDYPNEKLPKQTVNQLTGKRGERLFINLIPNTWNYYKPESDLGADFIVEVWNETKDSKPISLEFAAQIKCHERFNEENDDEKILFYQSNQIIQPKVLYERITISQFNYLGNKNGQLFSLFLNAQLITQTFRSFAGLFDPETRDILNSITDYIQVTINSPKLFFVSNIKSICDLYKDYNIEIDKNYINIPLLPHNSTMVPSNLKFIDKNIHAMYSRQKDEYLKIEYDLSSADCVKKIIFFPSWKSKVINSLTKERFNLIEKIKYIPFLPIADKSEVLKNIYLSNINDVSVHVEILIAVAYCKCEHSFEWIMQIISESNASINYLVLKCLRIHKIDINICTFKKYIACLEKKSGWFESVFYDSACSNYFVRGYYNEVINYLEDCLQTGKNAMFELIIKSVIEEKPIGTSSFFGQLTDGTKSDNLLNNIGKIMTQYILGKKNIKFNTHSIIKMANMLGIACYAFDDREP